MRPPFCASRTTRRAAIFRTVTDGALGWPLPTWGAFAPSRNDRDGAEMG
jgi:hypothetical protein